MTQKEGLRNLHLPARASISSDEIPNTLSGENSFSKQEDESHLVKYGEWLNATDLLITGEGEIFPLVLESYGISHINAFHSPESVSVTSKKGIIDTDHGSYFLKKKADYSCSPEGLELSAEFQEYLAGKTTFVPHIIRTTDNKPYAQIGSQFFLLTEYRKGRLFHGTIEDVSSAGHTLGQLHTLSVDFPDTNKFTVKASKDDALSFLGLADTLSGTENDQWKEETMSGLRRILNKNAMTRVEITTELPHIINHGDFAPFNLVFGNDGVLAVNDFDNNGRFPRIRDIADAIITFCDGVNYGGATSMFRRPISTQFSVEKAKAFYRSYSSHAQEFSENEKNRFITELMNRWVELMALGLVRGDFGYYDVLQALKFAEFAEENIGKIFL